MTRADVPALCVVMPLRAEFGMSVWWHAPAVHAIEEPKIVYIEPGMEALYPNAFRWIVVKRQEDSKRRNRYQRDADFVNRIKEDAGRRFPHAKILLPGADWPRRRFVPQPYISQGVSCEVVICPRKREYGAEKNWEHWAELAEQLAAEGLDVFAGGAPDSSYDVPCRKAWDYERNLDATIEAMHSAKLVVATDAGLAHLAVLCGRPLFMITHDNGLVAPGPVTDETGRVMEPNYWPVKMHRYTEANHTGSPINLIHYAWYSPDVVMGAVLEGLC